MRSWIYRELLNELNPYDNERYSFLIKYLDEKDKLQKQIYFLEYKKMCKKIVPLVEKLVDYSDRLNV